MEEELAGLREECELLTRRNDRMRAALLWIVHNAREAGCSAVVDEAEGALEGE